MGWEPNLSDDDKKQVWREFFDEIANVGVQGPAFEGFCLLTEILFGPDKAKVAGTWADAVDNGYYYSEKRADKVLKELGIQT